MAAPGGKSKAKEAARPAALGIAPRIQPSASGLASEDANRTARAAGTMRNEKTSSDPAIAPELVTTTPKLAENTNSQKSAPVPLIFPGNSQCSSPTAA